MLPVLFLIAGLPAAVALDRVIARLGALDEPLTDDERLPWQSGVWPARVRHAFALLLAPAMALAAWRFDPLQAAGVSLLVAALLVCTATDLIRYRVPNLVTYPGIVLALVAAAVMPDADAVGALAAATTGAGCFLVLAILTRGGLGLGDVKLAALIGAALGLQAGYQALFIGVLVGGLSILALFLAGVVGRKQAVPYAPFLALSAVAIVYLEGAAFAPL